MTIISGLLVGFGASLGSGCTSGHGVCGLARLSRRSIVATAIFFSFSVISLYLGRHIWQIIP
ncbi:MAG: YeeE/YedE family protein [Proteobacteria bacterium]|nr:YeeE/YedE family protein [Pseudomonadota bacterium]